MYKILSLLCFFLCISFNVFSETITVTSNADNGAGTLREALIRAAANGTAEKDYIHFNLPDQSETGRTIKLLSQLPAVSSNLDIDASTQPGNKFGVSTASVQLLFEISLGQELSGFLLEDQHDVGIYGLYLRILTDTRPSPVLTFWKGIQIEGCRNIQIGAAGKGNVISGFYLPLSVNFDHQGYTENLILRSNFFGVEADGNTISGNVTDVVHMFGVLGNINIGGTAEEGNIFGRGLLIYQVNNGDFDSGNPADYYYVTPAVITIKSNKVGVNYAMDTGFSGATGLFLVTISPGGKNTYFIEENVISTQNSEAAITLVSNKNPATLLRNYIGTDPTGIQRFPIAPTGIFLRYAPDVKIGNDDPANANYITGCKPVDIFQGVTAAVNKNSFFCTVNAYPMIGTNNPINVTVDIRSTSPNAVSGKATPNAVIELFYADQCGTCSPETYFASTTAGADGNWQYNGVLHGTVVASATYNHQTSEFTRVNVNFDNLQVVNECSGGDGAIRGLIPQSGSDIKWVDEQNNTVGTDPELTGVGPGKYKMILTNGDCSFETPFYEVYAGTYISDSGMSKVQPSCAQANGSVSNLVVYNPQSTLTFSWRDQGGREWSTLQALENVPAGAYTLTVTTPGGCTQTYGPVVLTDGSGPNIDISAITTLSSPCNGTAGSISNVVVSGTGVLRFRWLDQANVVKASGTVTGSSVGLRGVGPGSYRLEITDESQCPAVVSVPIPISESSGFNIDERAVQIGDEDCSYLNGSITGITVAGASTIQWLDEEGEIAGTAENLTGVKAGKYHLVAVNANGCTRESSVYEIGGPVRVTYVLTAKINDISCINDIGTIEMINNGADEPLAYHWVDADGNNAGTGPKIEGAAGTYALYLTDINHCERLYANFPIHNTRQILAAPLVSDVKICASGDALIQVSNAREGSYTLYDDQDVKLDESTTGSFHLSINESAAYKVIHRLGNCESPAATVSVAVETGGLKGIANSFSPNGDGLNDHWQIPGMANYPDGVVAVFNRQGTKVFQSTGYKEVFNGKYKGIDLPVGTYYYIIDLKRTCGLLTGSLTIIK